MFRIEDMKIDTISVYENSKGEKIEFIIEAIINRRLREEIEAEKVYVLLNKYIAFKGKEFQDLLYDKLVESKNTIQKQIVVKDLEPLPYRIVHTVLDIFDFDDIRMFLVQNRLINVPSNLPDIYDNTIELDERGSREQTYLKEDYIDLITLITLLKSVTGVIGAFTTLKDGILKNNVFKEYLLFNFFKTHKVYKNRAFIKIYESLEKLVSRLVKDGESTAVRIIEKNITKEILPIYIIANVIIQKLLLNNEIDDNVLRNTVTRFYNFASDRLKLNDANSKVKIKYHSNEDTETLDSASVFESVRSNSTIVVGYMVEFNHATSNCLRLVRQLGLNTSEDKVKRVLRNFQQLKTFIPIHEATLIASWIHQDILDPRSLDYLKMDNLINILASSFIYLQEHGFHNLSMIVSSYAVVSDDFKINFSLRNKITPALKNHLDTITFPYLRNATINSVDTTVNLVDNTITVMSKQLVSYILVTVLNEGHLKMYNNGDMRKEVMIKEDIKNQLAKLMIFINK